MRRWLIIGVALASVAQAAPQDPKVAARGEQIAGAAAAYLLTQQDESGGWGVPPAGPNLPAITGLVVTALVDHDPALKADPRLQRAVAYMLGFQQPDGGIYDTILPSYNTAICLSALSRFDTPEAVAAITPARAFLLGLQYSEDANVDGPAGANTMRVGREHPFYGGIGYGNHSRPDGSNLHFFMNALQDSGYSADEPGVQRALVFLGRIQMLDETNDMAYADGSTQGGFIYSTGQSAEEAGQGESKAGEIEETLDDGTSVSRLRAYGSMSYAGFKSYAYAQLAPDDPRVVALRRWLGQHYTLEENPGVGLNGLYYYFMTFGRGLDAWGADTIDTTDGQRDWAADLIDRLAGLQNEDGSFQSVDSRWMEDNPVLITAYGLIALNAAED